MQIVLPRILLVLVSVAVALFCYYESVYYQDHATILGARSADVRLWMWVFRGISLVMLIFAAILVIDLTRRLF